MQTGSLDRGFRPGAHIVMMLLGFVALWSDALLIAQERTEPSVVSGREAALQQLVEQELLRLGSDARAERVAAEERLLEAGPAVLELLPPAGAADDAATREALRRIRGELERRAAQASVRPSRVTLRGTMTATELVERISLQTGNPVSFRTDDDSIRGAQLDVDYNDVPFWDALSDLCGRLELRADTGSDRRSVVLAAADTDLALASEAAGAFRIEVLSLRSRGSVVRVEFSVTAEPRLRPLFLSWADARFAARMSLDRELPPFSPDARRELPALDRGRSVFSVVFQSPEPQAESEAAMDLSGRVVVTTAALTREFRFRDLTMRLGRESQRSGGVAVTRRHAEFSTTRNGVRRAEIELGVVYDTGGPAFESHRTWVYHNEVFLETPGGEQLPVNDGFETLGEQDGAVAVRYRFRDLPDVPPEDLQLVYHAPTAVIEVPLEFEFDRLPITTPQSPESRP